MRKGRRKNPVMVGVVGAGECGEELSRLAREVGMGIAKRGGIVVCGGLGGVMASACEGARAEGGLTVGILPGTTKGEANPYVVIPIITGLRDARNAVIARTSDVVIAIGGHFGTLSEIAFAMKFGVPVIGLNSWDVIPAPQRAASPGEAVEMAWALAGDR